MTTRETIEALRSSEIWVCLSEEEKADAISYALSALGLKFHRRCERDDMAELLGETYGG